MTFVRKITLKSPHLLATTVPPLVSPIATHCRVEADLGVATQSGGGAWGGSGNKINKTFVVGDIESK